jgi:DNA-binding transcriptional LysR family regulator
MLDLRRLRLLRELHHRGTVAAVADALQYTPSAVSQQLAVLEREAGVKLVARAGRGVRLTDPGLVLVEHAERLLADAERAEADLAAAAQTVAGRARISSFQSAAVRVVIPAMDALTKEAPRLRCELVEAEPEQALPALTAGDVDLVIADEWQHLPLTLPAGLARHDLFVDPVHVVLPARHPVARRYPEAVPLVELRDEVWAAGYAALAWAEMVERTCRAAGFEPDIVHRSVDANLSLALVRRGMAVTLLPGLILPEDRRGIAIRRAQEGALARTVIAVTRRTDEQRPSTRALLDAISRAARDAGRDRPARTGT